MHNRQKKIAVINDFCGFGRCSVSVMLPVISALKVQCCALPTAVFSNHTGFQSFFSTDYTDNMDAFIAEWVKLGLRFDSIVTGFLGSEKQVETVRRFFEFFKTDENTVIIDPVMGDDGRLYSTYPESLAKRMRALVPYADILIPNLTEACILTDTPYCERKTEAELTEIAMKLSSMGPEKIVISGLECDGDIENFIYEKGKDPVIVKEHKAGPCRAGTGDVFTAIVAADTVNGKSLSDAVRHAASFVAKCLRRTAEMNIPETDGICIEELLTEIGE